MDAVSLASCLESLPIGKIRYFQTVDSTNNEALRWVDQAAPHLSLVVADEQTAGRGRYRRKWVTLPGSALAFSLILRPPFYKTETPPQDQGIQYFTRLTALGALSVANALDVEFNLPVQIKWPNDLLVSDRKVAGVLAELSWSGDQINAAVVGIGINISPDSIRHQDQFDTPAGCVEQELNHSVSRTQLLLQVLRNLLLWLDRIHTTEFLDAWNERLAYHGQWVLITPDSSNALLSPFEAKIVGLDQGGGLLVQLRDGHIQTVQTGVYRISPGRVDPR